MSQGNEQAWLIRHYAPVALAVVLLTTAAGLAVVSALARSAPYVATALVIASDVQIRPEQLPRFGESVFASGTVAADVTRDLDLQQDYRTLVPDVIEMDPVPESISFLVHGRADGPAQAARLADAAAVAFVNQLNKAGAGVGIFVLQDTARPPLERDARGPGLALAVVISFIAGTILAVVVIWTLFNLRGPVVSAQEAARVASGRLLAIVHMRRRSRKSRIRPSGLRKLARELLALPSDVVVLAGTRRSTTTRTRLTAALSEIPEVASRLAVLPSAEDVTAGLYDRRAAVVLVVEQGTPAAHVDAVRANLLDDEITGIVFVSWQIARSHVSPTTYVEQRVPATSAPRLVGGRTAPATVKELSSVGWPPG